MGKIITIITLKLITLNYEIHFFVIAKSNGDEAISLFKVN